MACREASGTETFLDVEAIPKSRISSVGEALPP